MRSLQKQTDDAASHEFMLQEYKMLQERFQSLREEGIKRLTFFVTLTSAVIGGLLIIGNGMSQSPVPLKLLWLVALTLLAIIGSGLFRLMPFREASLDRVVRGMNRVRRYFIEHDPALSNYVIYPYHDEPTGYLTEPNSGLRQAAQTMQSFLLGFAIGIVVDLLNIRLEIAVTVGLAIFILDFLFLERSARRVLTHGLAQAKSDVRFPKTE